MDNPTDEAPVEQTSSEHDFPSSERPKAVKPPPGYWWRPLSFSPNSIQARLREAEELEEDGKIDAAIQVYQQALVQADAKSSEGLPILTNCLSRLARLHAKKEQYQMALQYAQAEKFIYEKALLDLDRHETVDDEEKETTQRESDQEQDPKRRAALQKAESLERLSRILLKSGSSELALQYAYQAINIRVGLGQELKSLPDSYIEALGTAYAAEGRKAYNDALRRYVDSKLLPTEASNPTPDETESQDSPTIEQASLLMSNVWIILAVLAFLLSLVIGYILL